MQPPLLFREVAPDWVLAGVLAAPVWSLICLSMSERCFLGLLLWLVVICAGAALQRWAAAQLVVAAGAPWLSTLVFEIDTRRGEASVVLVMLANAPGLAVLAAIAMHRARRRPVIAALFFGLIPAVPGAGMLRDGTLAWHEGRDSTPWSDPRIGYIYDQWSMTPSAAIGFGAAMLLIGVAIPAGVVAVRGRWWRRCRVWRRA